MGARYEMLDMLASHVDSAHRQLVSDFDRITVMNASGVVMVIPKDILNQAGVGERCFWENDAY